MQEVADMELLRQYVHRNSEEAFAALVRRHLNMVYSVALRKTGTPHAAEEIAQAVFVILARKSAHLHRETVLSGWLYHAARLTAASYLRTETRRVRREQEAYMETIFNEPESEIWPQIEPLLEDAIGKLNEKERNAIALRFFEGRSFQQIATVVGISENAAKKRVFHALEKLRTFFARRGVVSTATIIGGAISANSTQAAPAALTETITAVAVAKGAAAGSSTLTLIKGALKLMAWTKAKTVMGVSATILLAVGTTTVTVKEIQRHQTYPWQTDHPTADMLEQAQPQIRILPAKYPLHRGPGITSPKGPIYRNNVGKMFGLSQSLESVVRAAYSFENPARFIFPANLLPEVSDDDFDFIASLPRGNSEALQREVKRKFGLVAKTETREANVLLLKVKFPNAPGLRAKANNGAPEFTRVNQHYRFVNTSLSEFASNLLEPLFAIPVIDRTGLIGRFDIDISFQGTALSRQPDRRETFKEALLKQLGLELVSSREPIEMLVVEKVN